jgi:hypothetical protein
MELMQGYPKEDGAIGVDDVDRWPLDSNAVDFLSITESVTSVVELTKVREVSIYSAQSNTL